MLRPRFLAVLVLSACGGTDPAPALPGEPSVPAPSVDPPSAVDPAERSRAVLSLRGEASTVMITARRPSPSLESRQRIAPTSGVLAIDLDSSAIERFAVELDDIRISERVVPPDGVVLTGISLGFEPGASQLADDGTVLARGTLVLDWSLIGREGETHSLRSLRFEDTELVFTISSGEDGKLSATVGGGASGTLWDWGGLVELADLAFEIQAGED